MSKALSSTKSPKGKGTVASVSSGSKLLTVRIDGEQLQQLRLATVAHGVTMAQIVRCALSQWAKEHPVTVRHGKARAK